LEYAIGILAIALLIAINGYFVAAEFALVAVRKTRVEEMINQGVSGAHAVETALANLDRSIAACQLGITVASLALGAVGETLLATWLEPAFAFLPENWRFISKHGVASVIAILMITVLHVILGEQIPKMAALQTADRTAVIVSRPLNVFAKLSAPILKLMSGVTNWLLKQMGFEPGGTEASVHSVEELQMLVEDTQEAGFLDEEQAEFVLNVFELSDKKVQECMVPREKMDALELHTPWDKVVELVRNSGHTRIPVYDGELDNIVGILNTKNLFYYLTLQNVVVLYDCLYPATFLDPEETIHNALRLFRKSRRPMALVRDSENRIHGLITLEDVLEEIVGDIEDEHDAPVARLPVRTRRTTPVIRPQAQVPLPPPSDPKPKAGS
jgi:magnesium and cobalt exporter, CNNM family